MTAEPRRDADGATEGTVTVRRGTAADINALGPVIASASARGDLAGSSDVHGTFTLDVIGFAPGETAVAISADGSVAGFVQPEIKSLVVEPDRRREGIGRSLVAAGLEIERERRRDLLLLGIVSGDAAGTAFLRATGFELHSLLWDLILPAGAAAVEPPAWPAGIVGRRFDRTRDVDAFAAVFNEAFQDHPTPMVVTPEMIRARLDDPRAIDADVLVLEADGRLIGFCQTNPRRPEFGLQTDEVAMIGVAAARQGEGLGSGLLSWGVRYLRDLGAGDVTLSVNGRNPHALGLYERRGFVRVSTRERWARSVGTA